MKKRNLLIIICLLFINVAEVLSQALTFQETKELLYGHKWFLRRLELDGSMYTIPKDIQGLKRVFMNNGMSYSYLPSDNEAEVEQHKWTITKTHITFYMYDEPQVYRYRVEDFLGYTLYLDLEGDDDMPTFVFEIAEKVDPAKLVNKTATGALSYEQIKSIEKKNEDPISEKKFAGNDTETIVESHNNLINTDVPKVMTENNLNFLKDFFAKNFVKTPVKVVGYTDVSQYDYEIKSDAIIIYKKGITNNEDNLRNRYHWFYLPITEIEILDIQNSSPFFETVDALSLGLINNKWIPHGQEKKFIKLENTQYSTPIIKIPLKINSREEWEEVMRIFKRYHIKKNNK